MKAKKSTVQKPEIKGKKRYAQPGSGEAWSQMVRYYRWVFFAVFGIFGAVLLWERTFIVGISFLAFAWYVCPIEQVRKTDERLGVWKKIILYGAIALLILWGYRIFNG